MVELTAAVMAATSVQPTAVTMVARSVHHLAKSTGSWTAVTMVEPSAVLSADWSVDAMVVTSAVTSVGPMAVM